MVIIGFSKFFVVWPFLAVSRAGGPFKSRSEAVFICLNPPKRNFEKYKIFNFLCLRFSIVKPAFGERYGFFEAGNQFSMKNYID